MNGCCVVQNKVDYYMPFFTIQRLFMCPVQFFCMTAAVVSVTG